MTYSSTSTDCTCRVLSSNEPDYTFFLQESVPVAVIHTTKHLTGSSSPSWADVSTF